jgi:hypothetical protein
MKSLLIALAFLASCGGIFRSPLYTNPVDETMYEASVRIQVQCEEGTYMGSGVAIDGTHVITARHVVTCDIGEPMTILVKLRNGMRIFMDLKAHAAEGRDISLLEAPDPGYSYFTTAEIRQDPPKIGEMSCVVSGQLWDEYSLRKCGAVGMVTDQYIVSSFHAVPGNSGSGLYDADGRIIGILVMGKWAPQAENFAISEVTSGFVWVPAK